MGKTIKFFLILMLIFTIFVYAIYKITYNNNNIITSSQISDEDLEKLSNKKIEWGIKRADNHKQPDVGTTNRKILDEYQGIYMGNNEKKYIYLTFDLGYEAGYTSKILEILKNNNVKATFFITAHYLNTQEEIVKQMIEEGHIVGNHTTSYLMSINEKCIL